jgi:hypothetical protein
MVLSQLQHTEYKVPGDYKVVAYGSLRVVFMQLNGTSN